MNRSKNKNNIEVSCEIMFTFTPGSSWFGLTDHNWSFYTDIGVVVVVVVIDVVVVVVAVVVVFVVIIVVVVVVVVVVGLCNWQP